MITEHDRIALTAPGSAQGLEAGDVGTAVYLRGPERSLKSSSRRSTERPPPVATVETPAFDRVTSQEITHSRELTQAK